VFACTRSPARWQPQSVHYSEGLSRTRCRDRDEACSQLPFVVILYAALGIVLAFLFTRLSSAAEVNSAGENLPSWTLKSILGISHSRHVVAKLASLFALDSFAGASSCKASLHIGSTCVSVQTRNTRRHFLWRISLRESQHYWRPALLPLRTDQHDGCYAPSSNILLILVPLMPIFLWLFWSAGAFQYQSNGCTD